MINNTVHQKFAGAAPFQREIKRLNIFNNRGICRPSVLEENSPFDGWKVQVLDTDTAHHQAGIGIGKAKNAFHSVLVQRSNKSLQLPILDSLSGGLPCVDEGE